MSIKSQKIIRFIPFLNFFVTEFFLIGAMRRSPKARQIDIFLFVLKGFVALLLVDLPEIILSYFIESEMFQLILSYLTVYVGLFVISTMAIIQQEKYIEEKAGK